jgi:hypothetical protein
VNLAAAFLLGLAGSFHCAVMCGPLVLAVQTSRGRGRFGNLAYHGGRIATYAVLGAVSGLIGAAIAFAGFQRWISIAAGFLVLLASLTSFTARMNGWIGKTVLAVKARFGLLLHNQSWGASVLLGGLNGLLPCGLVYVACATAVRCGDSALD